MGAGIGGWRCLRSISPLTSLITRGAKWQIGIAHNGPERAESPAVSSRSCPALSAGGGFLECATASGPPFPDRLLASKPHSVGRGDRHVVCSRSSNYVVCVPVYWSRLPLEGFALTRHITTIVRPSTCAPSCETGRRTFVCL